MAVKRITDSQIKHFFYLVFKQFFSVTAAALAAEFSRRSGYYIMARWKREKAEAVENGAPLSKPFGERRQNKPGAGAPSDGELDAAFEKWGVPLLQASTRTSAASVVIELRQRLNKDLAWSKSKKRSIERRVKKWKEAYGASPEMFFPRLHEPGAEMQVDFKKAGELGVTIAGKPFQHMLYHARLTYSGRTHIEVVTGGESFAALQQGTQNAFAAFRGVPKRVRTDRLSAASKNIKRKAKAAATLLWQAFAELCGFKWTPTNAASPEENGSAESGNRHRYCDLDQALIRRGSREFDSREDYEAWVRETLEIHNETTAEKFKEELEHLGPLPERCFETFKEEPRTPDKESLVRVGNTWYSVPPRHIKKQLRVRIFQNRIELRRNGELICIHDREPAVVVNGKGYRVKVGHVIRRLKRKALALLDLKYRECLWPDRLHRMVFERALERLDAEAACMLSLELLELADEFDCAEELAAMLERDLQADRLPDADKLRRHFQSKHDGIDRSEPLVVEADARLEDAANDSPLKNPDAAALPAGISGECSSAPPAEPTPQDDMRRQALDIGMTVIEGAERAARNGDDRETAVGGIVADLLIKLAQMQAETAKKPSDPAESAPSCEKPRTGNCRGGKRTADGNSSSPTKAGTVAKLEYIWPTAVQIATAHGGLKKEGGHYVGKCPLCGGRDRFRVHIATGMVHCHTCLPDSKKPKIYGNMMRALGLSIREPVVSQSAPKEDAAAEGNAGESTQDNETPDNVRSMVNICVPYPGSPSEKHMREARCVTQRSDSLLHTSIAYHGELGGRHECMVVKFVNTRTGTLMALQRTYINVQDRKKRRRSMGRFKGTGALISGSLQSETWTVAEGVECALSIAESGVGGAVLATGGTPNMKEFQVPDHVRLLLIASDNDKEGQEAAETLRQRVEGPTLKVAIRKPEPGCKDWNEMHCRGMLDEVKAIIQPDAVEPAKEAA